MIQAHVYIVKYEHDDNIYVKIDGMEDDIVPMVASAIVENETLRDALLVASAYFKSINNN